MGNGLGSGSSPKRDPIKELSLLEAIRKFKLVPCHNRVALILWDTKTVLDWFGLLGVPRSVMQQLPAFVNKASLDGQLIEDLGVEFWKRNKDNFSGFTFNLTCH